MSCNLQACWHPAIFCASVHPLRQKDSGGASRRLREAATLAVVVIAMAPGDTNRSPQHQRRHGAAVTVTALIVVRARWGRGLLERPPDAAVDAVVFCTGPVWCWSTARHVHMHVGIPSHRRLGVPCTAGGPFELTASFATLAEAAPGIDRELTPVAPEQLRATEEHRSKAGWCSTQMMVRICAGGGRAAEKCSAGG